MMTVEQLAAMDGGLRHHRRHPRRRRSRLNRFSRRLRRIFENRKLRRGLLSLILATSTVVAGYWASMYVASQRIPTSEELYTNP